MLSLLGKGFGPLGIYMPRYAEIYLLIFAHVFLGDVWGPAVANVECIWEKVSDRHVRLIFPTGTSVATFIQLGGQHIRSFHAIGLA